MQTQLTPTVQSLLNQVDHEVKTIFGIYGQQLTQMQLNARDPAAAPSVRSIISIVTRAVASIMRTVETTVGFSIDDKKAAVLELAGTFYDQVLLPLVLQQFPLLGNRWIGPAGREVFLELVAGIMDSLMDIFNRTGWFDVPAGTNGAQAVPTPTPTFTTPSNFVPY